MSVHKDVSLDLQQMVTRYGNLFYHSGRYIDDIILWPNVLRLFI